MARKYYWIIAYMEEQPYLIFGGETESEARAKAFEVLSTPQFTIREFPTRNVQTASAMFRGKRLEQTRDLRTSTRRIRHKISKRRRY